MFSLGTINAISELANMFHSKQSVREEYLQAEYDTTSRHAKVDIYSRAVEGLASVNGSTGGNGSAHHWLLVVQFEDNAYRTLEGNQNEDGYLHAYYSKHKDSGLIHLRQLGSVHISPSQLRSLARGNSLNGTRYDLVENNCQDWVLRAARDISEDIAREAARIPRITPVLSLVRNATGLISPFPFLR